MLPSELQNTANDDYNMEAVSVMDSAGEILMLKEYVCLTYTLYNHYVFLSIYQIYKIVIYKKYTTFDFVISINVKIKTNIIYHREELFHIFSKHYLGSINGRSGGMAWSVDQSD